MIGNPSQLETGTGSNSVLSAVQLVRLSLLLGVADVLYDDVIYGDDPG